MTVRNYFNLKALVPFFLIVTVLASCVSPKQVVYFQETSHLEKLISTNSFVPVFQVDDLLSITVSAENFETVRPFNQGQAPIGEENTAGPAPGYLIGTNGTINFPVLGSLKLAGLNRAQAIELITTRLKEYVKNPIVNIRINNFKITVIGDVNTPGSFTIPNERITIIEALGLASDLTIKGKRKNISVIRDMDGVIQFYKVDITSKDIFNSPVYYLAQNDVVYVEPNPSKIRSSGSNENILGVVLSLAGLGISVATLINISN